jgi:hypothetical protein
VDLKHPARQVATDARGDSLGYDDGQNGMPSSSSGACADSPSSAGASP